MADTADTPGGGTRNHLALGVLIFSAVAITAMAISVILKHSEDSMTVFNIVLPVFASWVGTVLVFYFGRENFDAANKQIKELVRQIVPENSEATTANAVMRSVENIIHVEIPAGGDDNDVKLSTLIAKFGDSVNRVPVLDDKKRPKYMIHESSIAKYLTSAGGGNRDDTLAAFVANRKKIGLEFGIDRGFVVVAEMATLAEAKRKMEGQPTCSDIFVTKRGGPDEPLTGWISNVRLSKSLEA